MIDTCQAATMAEAFRSPNVLAISSSLKAESSYSYTIDKDIGVALIDRFTWKALDFFNKKVKLADSNATLQDLMDTMDAKFLQSTASARTNLFPRPLSEVKISEFFSNEKQVQMTEAMRARGQGDINTTGYKVPEWMLESPSLHKTIFNEYQAKMPATKVVEFKEKESIPALGVLLFILLILSVIRNYINAQSLKK
jgi:glycosylphosphatidylinositol transamidase (GPIT) subunit GPI8